MFSGPIGAILNFVHIIVTKDSQLQCALQSTAHTSQKISIQFSSFNSGYWLACTFRHICRFIASLADKLFYFFAFSSSFSHSISDRTLRQLPAGDHVIISLGNNNNNNNNNNSSTIIFKVYYIIFRPCHSDSKRLSHVANR